GKAEHVSAISGGGIISASQGLHPIFVVADIAAQQPAPHRIALPALPAEVHSAFDERLPVRLASALEPRATALTLQSRVLHGARHRPSSTGSRPKIDQRSGCPRQSAAVCGRYQYIEKSGFLQVPPFAAVIASAPSHGENRGSSPLGSANDFKHLARSRRSL